MSATYFLRVYGCQMNFYEADLVRNILNRTGFEEKNSPATAEVLLIMTCAVREHAEKRALGNLRQLVNLKKTGSARVVGILGCMAQRLQDTLVNSFHADLVVGPDQYQRLPELINAAMNANCPQIAVELSDECYDRVRPVIQNRVSAYVTIMRGCSNFCSYCIVPHVRGKERFRASEAILSEIDELTAHGVREIVLLGQNVLAYNYNDFDFCRLLAEIHKHSKVCRIRFLTSHPRDLNERIVKTIATLPRICPQLHLPVQSGSDRILKLMNRGYTIEEYRNKVALIRQYLPEISLTTDVIVGFPTETEDEFCATLELIKSIRFDYAYMFKFSPRPGTPASLLTPTVPENVIRERLLRLIETQNQITRESNRAMLGKIYEILIEGESPRGSGCMGKTPQGKVVVVDESLPAGSLVNVRIVEVRGWTPKGEIVFSSARTPDSPEIRPNFPTNMQEVKLW
ncbi:MAG: tRNA (N6-isopentenyl adenosine(37)-C2)-methylthiotransferase MiaB [candidate division WOR-3 bacterium]